MDATMSRAADNDGSLLLKGGTLDQVKERLVSLLAPGDLIFVDRRGLPYRHIARSTRSWTSQVGLCLRDSKGDWVVYEAGVPMVRRVELTRFIRRTRGNRLAVRRLQPQPNAEQLVRLTQAANRCVGRFNGLSFDYDSAQLFGPKMIRELFCEVLGYAPGKIVTMADMREGLPRRSLWFWRFWFVGVIPWRRRTMTPHSLYSDPVLKTIFESY